MHSIGSRRLAPQRGMSLLGLVIVAVIVGFFALMTMRVFPSINEYLTIRKSINQIMKAGPTSAEEIRTAFGRQKEVEYSISSLDPKDLQITKNGERLVTRYAYQVEVPIVEPVFLLIKYDGMATSGGGSGP